ncbi:uncharacterized protein LOC128550922 [Mercenaria mercenaria]|uniref:uncharacterized protein LOC128550922 n=1 Tax=Mercenaria mercenaria TaxID=6596 RepID=UPI00234ED13B|nr:uncharacterized protein LOC128550922 [Mercenaria mercenaria]XP_053386964.1 uncharacterized protein LOC128550922 [Mercenaria mercenaria]
MSDNPEETAYYLRLISMYMDLCTESVRKVFDFYSPNNNGEEFIRLNQDKLNELKTNGILNQQECEVVITQWPNLKLMDISLLITLSINLFTTVQLAPPTKGWNRPPKSEDISIAADLLRLRKIRNVIVGHHPCARLPQWVFENEWENIKTILLRIEGQIDPENEVHLQSQIDCYLIQQLQPCIQNEHDSKLKEWYQEVSIAQKQVDEYLKNLEGFNVYLKEKSDRYERYIKLLVEGGRFVLSALIKTKCQQSDLRCKLDEKEDILREKIIDSEHLEILYPSTSDRLATPLDFSVWDISLLTGVLLYAFECSGDLKEAIDNLYNARMNYAEVAVKSLDPDDFVDYLSDLKYSISVAKNYLNSEEKSHINKILEESKKKAKEDGSFKIYMEELKSQGFQMKTFSDIHKETVQKTKETLQQMITHGISFDSNRVLELKMITVGSDEEKKKLVENILFEVLEIALGRTENKDNFQEIQEEVNKVLKKIKKSKNIQDISVEQKCILLQIASREPYDMLALIEYFESDLFLKTLDDICKWVGYHCDTIVAICSNVTIESLHGILNEEHLPKQQESGIRVPITVSSPADMMELWKLFRSEQFSNSINAIAEKLSKHSKTKITLKTFTDLKEFNDVFDEEIEQSSSDSESNDSLTPDSSQTLDTKLDFPYKGDVAGHPAVQSSKYDKRKVAVETYKTSLSFTKLRQTGKHIRDVFRSKKKKGNGGSPDDKDKKTPDMHCLLKEPWRCLDRKGTWTEKYAKELLSEIQKHEVKDTDISNIRILLLGPVSAGKSSFLNTVASIDKERVAQITVAAGSIGSTTYVLKEFRPQGKLENFCILDTMGVDDSDQGGLNLKDAVYVVKGNIRPGYKFNPVCPIDEGNKDFRSDPNSKEKIHCVAFVCDANVIGQDNISDMTRAKIKTLQDELKAIDVPRVVLLTKIDQLCEWIDSDITNCYKSVALRKAVNIAEKLFELPEMSIFPVQNYTDEYEMDARKDILSLLALRQMLLYGIKFLYKNNFSDESDYGCVECEDVIATTTKLKGDEASDSNTKNYSNQQLDQSNLDVFLADKIKANEKGDLPKIAETDTQLLVDFINFHEFKGIFL